jgi:hypothetical protein
MNNNDNSFEEFMDPELAKKIREGTATNKEFIEQFNKFREYVESNGGFEYEDEEEETLEVPEKY